MLAKSQEESNMSEFKSGFVTILGLPNVGKSTLINRLVGEKVAIVSPKPQTTRNSAVGVYNDDNSQIVFVDTPGIHKSVNKIDEYMEASISSASQDTDVLLFMLSAKKPLAEQYDILSAKYKSHSAPRIVVINKIDETTYERMYPILDDFMAKYKVDDILPLSALTGKNCDVLIDMLKKHLPSYDAPMRYYPVEQYTDKSARYLASEIIREKILLNYDEEVPHGVAVEIASFEEKDNVCVINADIIVERDSHKAIILGHNGEAIKRLATMARMEMQKVLETKIFLELFVKVKKDWRDNSKLVTELGYDIKSLKD